MTDLKTSGVMVLQIDAGRCQGHNRCYALAPSLVDVDDFGQAVVRGDGVVSTDLQATAELVVANCPEFAITLVRTEGGGAR